MILGNPYQFSITIDVVEKWNLKDAYSFYNGILIFGIDGKIFPHRLVNATLGSEVPNLIRQFSHIPINKKLFNMKKKEAFLEIYHITHPEDVDIDDDYSYDVTPYSFGDINCFVFAVSNGEQVRILASCLEYRIEEGIHEMANIEITEAYISVDEMAEFVSKLNMQLSQQVLLNETYKTQ